MNEDAKKEIKFNDLFKQSKHIFNVLSKKYAIHIINELYNNPNTTFTLADFKNDLQLKTQEISPIIQQLAELNLISTKKEWRNTIIYLDRERCEQLKNTAEYLDHVVMVRNKEREDYFK